MSDCRVEKETNKHYDSMVDVEEFTEEQKLAVFCPSSPNFDNGEFVRFVEDAISEMGHSFCRDEDFYQAVGDLALDEDFFALGEMMGDGIRNYLLNVAERKLSGEVF